MANPYPIWVLTAKNVRSAKRACDAAREMGAILRRNRLRADARRASRAALKAQKAVNG